MIRTAGCLLALALTLGLPLAAQAKTAPAEIDWIQMIPPDELKAMQDPPPISHFGGQMQQLFQSAKTVKEMDGVRGKLAGYVVPLTMNDDGKTTEFFFVPYFGACLHMPPPPPNQIVYVKTKSPVDPGSGWEPYWLIGTLRTTGVSNDLAKSAYSMDFEALELWEEP